jgi:hypothetical protein
MWTAEGEEREPRGREGRSPWNIGEFPLDQLKESPGGLFPIDELAV